MPMIRKDHADLIYKTEAAKFAAVADDIAERYDSGQPVLVGTASVEKSEVLSTLMDRRGIPHNVLNAKQHAREAGIVAQAGRLHAVTVATNMAGRGVDILLGGNPEGLAAQEISASGTDPESDEAVARYAELLAKYQEVCSAEGDKIRELGGLYVLGSERHESRRIDNQLRGRTGRQGDPGESRFFLSLEDELMRLFATGAMNWVMGRALPEDVPIEARMVTKAIERAQNTVEARNAEIRKDVLKYDEVMNEQRKVIYARRHQILEGEDLRARTLEILGSALETIVRANCPGEFVEQWDLEGLVKETRLYYPTAFTADELAEAATPDQIYESLLTEAVGYYEEREASMPGDAPEETMRTLEREIMLQLIDQKWREHLSEMDYLREGINLRAMGQQDPLVEWQREGYDMFGQMMSSIDDDYVKIVMHAQVQVLDQAAPDETAELSQARYSAAEEPVQGLTALQRARARGPAPGEEVVLAEEPSGNGQSAAAASPGGSPAVAEAPQVPLVKDSVFDKAGRNDPCPCGSGKKFKFCHGR
jgi:preprotein translocase subunit SecA